MKLLKFGALTALAAGAFGLSAYTVACGTSKTDTDSGTTMTGAQPPPKPSAGPPATMDEQTFALNALLLGDTVRGSTATSTTAWKDYGFNIDGKISDAKSTDVCTRAAGAPSSVQTDGNRGIDNSFGANILPIIQSAGSIPNPSQTISDSIAKGSFTIQFKIKGLSGAMQTNTGLSAQLFASGVFDEDGGAKPTFTTADNWPVRPELLNDGKTVASGSKVTFPDSYITNGTFVTPTGTVTLSLVFQGVALDIEIVKAVIVMDIDLAGGNANNGTIAGVIPTEKLIGGLQSVAGRISKSLCGSAFDGIAQQIRQTSDINSDGSNSAGKACDAISIGIGFTAKHIGNATNVAGLGTAPPDPCSMSGDAGGD
jgi:hypothetical protein